MTRRRKHPIPKPEELATMQLIGTLQNVKRNVILANQSIPDLAGPYLIAEIEPIRRWQYGLTQLLEYWDYTLRSAHAVYIIIRDHSGPNPPRDKRLQRLCDSLGVRLWIWDAHTHKWTQGGTAHQPTGPPRGQMLRLDGGQWQPPADALKAYRKTREPYATWLRTYKARREGSQSA